MTNSRTNRAAEHLNAVKVSRSVWAHYDDGARRWYTVTSAQLAELCDYLDSSDSTICLDAYSHWCAGTSSKEMPADWSPPM